MIPELGFFFFKVRKLAAPAGGVHVLHVTLPATDTWVKRSRKMVFPNGRRWDRENKELYAQTKGIIREA